MVNEKGVFIPINYSENKPTAHSVVPPEAVFDPSELIDIIKTIIKRHGLADSEWTKAISSQNFLVSLAKILNFQNQKGYKDLLTAFIGSVNFQFGGTCQLAKDRILIIPDENKKLIACMEKEDEQEAFYPPALKAIAIKNPDRIYQNYLYGLMVNITSAEQDDFLDGIRKYCIDELFSNDALEDSGGWVHYRLPWITARVLLGLQNVTLVCRSDKDLIQAKIRNALDSLIDRIYDGKYWRSGAGEWVSKWESTGLCLEAIIYEDYITKNEPKMKKIDNVIAYLFTDEAVNEWLPDEAVNEWLPAQICLDPEKKHQEERTNKLLASICLASVLYRLLKNPRYSKYNGFRYKIEKIFSDCIKKLSLNTNIQQRQHCTIPQILFYVAKAVI